VIQPNDNLDSFRHVFKDIGSLIRSTHFENEKWFAIGFYCFDFFSYSFLFGSQKSQFFSQGAQKEMGRS